MILSADSAVLFGPVPRTQATILLPTAKQRHQIILSGFLAVRGCRAAMCKLASDWDASKVSFASHVCLVLDMARLFFRHWAGKAFQSRAPAFRLHNAIVSSRSIFPPTRARRAGRPVRPCLLRQMQKECHERCFPVLFRLGAPLWFRRRGRSRAKETIGSREQNWWGTVGREARMLPNAPAIIDENLQFRFRRQIRGQGHCLPRPGSTQLFANRHADKDRTALPHAADNRKRAGIGRRLHRGPGTRDTINVFSAPHGRRALPPRFLQGAVPLARGHDVPLAHRDLCGFTP